jgi:HAD superfamily hydrolase (TIGR01490 family)
MKKLAIFDIDGTLFRSSLLIELTDALVNERIFPRTVGESYRRARSKWLDREGSYEEYIDAVIKAFVGHLKGVKRKTYLRIADKVVTETGHRVYRYTRDLTAKLKKRGYFLLAVSNSPKEILDPFCKKWGFDKVYGRIYETNARGSFTGRIQYEALISDKSKILLRAVEREGLTLKGSVGVGDSEGDIPFLKLVQTPICFNPNKKLFDFAKKKGWKVVVERKDVVYE